MAIATRPVPFESGSSDRNQSILGERTLSYGALFDIISPINGLFLGACLCESVILITR